MELACGVVLRVRRAQTKPWYQGTQIKYDWVNYESQPMRYGFTRVANVVN